jgi:hypothetical protein
MTNEQILTKEELREKLSDRVLSIVARRTGVSVGTLYNITNSKTGRVNVITRKALTEYLNN